LVKLNFSFLIFWHKRNASRKGISFDVFPSENSNLSRFGLKRWAQLFKDVARFEEISV